MFFIFVVPDSISGFRSLAGQNNYYLF